MINLKQVFEVIVSKKFQDRDKQKMISGEFSNVVINKKAKVNVDVEEAREQD